MSNRRLGGWRLLVLATTLAAATPVLAAGSTERRLDRTESDSAIQTEMKAGESGGAPANRPDEEENSATEPLAYSDNQGWQDFEVHFFVSLPFTALYSYLSLSALDAAVQGRFPAEFRQTDMWMVIGMAVGSSLAIALGSLNRVPDQSQDLLPPSALVQPDKSGTRRRETDAKVSTLAAVEIRF